MFECEITVNGGSNSPSKDGGPVKGPVSSFFKNYTKCYTAIKNHVISCPFCCPDATLQRFLLTRDKPSLKGFTSAGLLDMALKMETGCRKSSLPGKKVSRCLVNEYLIRTGRPTDLIRHASRLDPAEQVAALKWIWRRWESDQEKSWMKGRSVVNMVTRAYFHDLNPDKTPVYWLIRTVGAEFDANRSFPPMEELERLATVAEVMYG